ncbi:MAG: hypothetical protein ACI87E_002282 [Mariniblastus sp.]|jgi:hypothetical protein
MATLAMVGRRVSFEVAHFCAAGAFRGGLGWPTEMFAVVVFGQPEKLTFIAPHKQNAPSPQEFGVSVINWRADFVRICGEKRASWLGWIPFQ